MIIMVYLENFRRNFCVLLAEFKAFFGGKEEAEILWKYLELNVLFSYKNYTSIRQNFWA